MNLAAAETQVLSRVSAALAAVSIDVGTVSPLPGLQDPIGFALALAGYPAADPTAVADADLAGLPAAKWYMVVDVAVVRLVELVALNYALKYQQEQLPDQNWIRDLKAVQAVLDRMRDYVKAVYGVGVPTLQGGSVEVVTLNATRRYHPDYGGGYVHGF